MPTPAPADSSNRTHAPAAPAASPPPLPSASAPVDATASAPATDAREAQLRALLVDLGVDTGDVVIFDRPCHRMSLYGGAICACAKFFGRTPWDHNGAVLRDPETGELLFLEAALSGVKLRPLVDRLARSQAQDIAIRRLQVPRSPEFHARAMDFARRVLDAPYEDQPGRFFNAGVAAPSRRERERLFRALIAEKKTLRRLENELEHRRHMPAFERKALAAARDAAHERYHALVAELGAIERSVFENPTPGGESDPATAHKVFCSQLVAALYQDLGLLLPYPSANSYLPKHFASHASGYLQLQHDAALLPEVSVRRELALNAERFHRRVEEATTRAPRAGPERDAILRCLRRHPLFHALSESRLHAIAGRFRRQVVDPDEVVFYQGGPGEFFYIIEDGECDVVVDYAYLERTRPAEEEAVADDDADGANAAATPALRRRKTLALPDFHSSSRLIGKDQRVLVATHGPGSAFGDSALIYDTPRRATIRASSRAPSVVLWRLDKDAFRQIVEENPSTQCSMEEYLFLMATLSAHPLFAALDDRAKALAVRKCFPLTFAPGTTILQQGDPGDYFYVIERGRCEIARMKPALARPVVDRIVGRGASFGEAALLYNSRRGASVAALDETKVWCMDRATFLTITRSGSSALFKMFQRLHGGGDDGRSTRATEAVDGAEAFIAPRDLQRMLRPRGRLPGTATTAPTTTGAADPRATARALRLADYLLFHDASGLVNFSQFAHFHIALGAANSDQLPPEAAFRVLDALARTHPNDDHVDARTTVVAAATTSTAAAAHDATIRLGMLPSLMREWTAGSKTATPSTMTTAAAAVDPGALERARRRLYARLFELPGVEPRTLEDARVTCDDLARALALLDEDRRGRRPGDDDDGDDPGTIAARGELDAFLAALTADLDVLRDLWRAAEFRAGGDLHRDPDVGKRALTFDANLRSGWISAIRHNPTGGDWESLRPTFSTSDPPSDPVGAAEFAEEPRPLTRLWAQTTAFAAAIASGALSRTVCAPLERLKILMQAPVPTAAVATAPTAVRPYAALSSGLANMARLGGLRAMYSGNLAHCLWVVPSLPAKFLLCDVYRGQIEALAPQAAPEATNLLAGGLAGVTANCLLYPLDLVRGRLSVQQYHSPTRAYAGIRDAFARIHQHEGPRAFYRGFGPASLGVFGYIGCNYAIYEALRPVFILYDTDTTGHQLGHPSIPGQILCATVASLTSQTLSYPFDLVRRRMQVQGAWHPQLTFPAYTSSWQCLQATMETSTATRWPRFSALYSGLFVNCVKALPSAIISFVSYEKIREMRTQADEAAL